MNTAIGKAVSVSEFLLLAKNNLENNLEVKVLQSKFLHSEELKTLTIP
ncbi:hypothetical protein [Dendronalium phyllosphericum]|nr:hypothetical protein [Dendronalium phyllosphericum]